MHWARLQLPNTIDRHLETEILLAWVLNRPRTSLIAWPDKRLTHGEKTRFEKLIDRRLQGEPTAYLIGRKEFWSVELKVTRDTLIPRPETETLVQRALELIPPNACWHIADLGTGSGAIAAAVSSERPHCRILATDRSNRALSVARENTRILGLPAVEFYTGDWYQALPPETQLNIILSNPPYVATGDPHLHRDGLPWEPPEALISGPSGLDAIQELVCRGKVFLKPGGWLLLEHGFDQGERVRKLLLTEGYHRVSTHRDLAGVDRISEGRAPLQ
ncbi:MAG: peptide chain release factor N(5)-glutamine methyltransferase [Gammaproteobacteria bacterium]|nr:peptide chain release factor N(5)-glutamine methyltransferase [Gammaproteobacteria bacterium]